ncbi:MAG: zinc-ribbon domain-containing protein [Candidatus Binataceae bacterium]
MRVAALMAFCAKCGNQLSEEAAFCTKCGAARSTQAPAAANPRIRSFAKWMWIGIAASLAGAITIATFAPNDANQQAATSNAKSDSAGNSNAARPAGDSADAEYAAAIARQTAIISQSLKRVAKLGKDPNYSDESWRFDFLAELAVWQVTYDSARKLNPPAKWRKVQTRYVLALVQLNSAAEDFARGLNPNDDEGLINQAWGEMKSYGSQMEKFKPEFQAVASSASRPTP